MTAPTRDPEGSAMAASLQELLVVVESLRQRSVGERHFPHTSRVSVRATPFAVLQMMHRFEHVADGARATTTAGDGTPWDLIYDFRASMGLFGFGALPPTATVDDDGTGRARASSSSVGDRSEMVTFFARPFPTAAKTPSPWTQQLLRPSHVPLVFVQWASAHDATVGANVACDDDVDAAAECIRQLVALHHVGADGEGRRRHPSTFLFGGDDAADGGCRPSPSVDDSASFDTPTEDIHRAAVNQALAAISRGAFDKVVLSRRRRRDNASVRSTTVAALAVRAITNNPSGAVFVRSRANEDTHMRDVFVGCTPERLFVRRGTLVEIDALAGTVRASERECIDGTRDESNGPASTTRSNLEAQFASTKLRIEQQFVADAICRDLRAGLGDRLSALTHPPAPSVVRAGPLHHLHTPIVAALDGPLSWTTLVDVLHPTPAVGGLPRTTALSFLDECESHHRGLYTGVLGASFADVDVAVVGIRGLHIHGSVLDVYTGGGIVLGSTAREEWDELDAKTEAILAMLDDQSLARAA